MLEAHDVRSGMLSKYKTPQAINDGGCGIFAERLKAKVAGAVIVKGSELSQMYELKYEVYGYYAHYVVLINGKLYDAENPNGVDHPDELNFYKNKLRNIHGF